MPSGKESLQIYKPSFSAFNSLQAKRKIADTFESHPGFRSISQRLVWQLSHINTGFFLRYTYLYSSCQRPYSLWTGSAGRVWPRLEAPRKKWFRVIEVAETEWRGGWGSSPSPHLFSILPFLESSSFLFASLQPRLESLVTGWKEPWQLSDPGLVNIWTCARLELHHDAYNQAMTRPNFFVQQYVQNKGLKYH